MKTAYGMLLLALFSGAALRAQTPPADPTVAAQEQKARMLLQQMVQSLGGDAWLHAPGYELIGRGAGFYHGQPTGEIQSFWDYRQPLDKERVELGKKRQVLEMYIGDKGWEVTYKGAAPIPQKELDDYLRRRTHSIDAVARVWMKDPGALYMYGGQEQVERRLADKVTILSSSDDNVTLDLDATTHRPLRCSFDWRDPLYQDKNTEAEEYDDYHTFNGVSTAFSIVRYHNGDMTNQKFLYNAIYAGAIPPEMFNVGAAVQKLKK